MLTAITRAVSPALANCELTFVERQPSTWPKPSSNTAPTNISSRNSASTSIRSQPSPTLPDSMFVEDPAIVLDELAVILPLGTKSRQPEAESLANALAPFRKLALHHRARRHRRRRRPPHRPHALRRPNHAHQRRGRPPTRCHPCASQLQSRRRPCHRLSSPQIRRHLSRTQHAPRKPPLVRHHSARRFPMDRRRPAEPHAANALAVGDTVIFPASFPKTRARIESAGFHVTPSRYLRTPKSRIRPDLLEPYFQSEFRCQCALKIFVNRARAPR